MEPVASPMMNSAALIYGQKRIEGTGCIHGVEVIRLKLFGQIAERSNPEEDQQAEDQSSKARNSMNHNRECYRVKHGFGRAWQRRHSLLK
jgi:hypothetical protein